MHDVTNSIRSGSARRGLRTSGQGRPTWLLAAAGICAALTAGSAIGQEDAARAKALAGPAFQPGDNGQKARQKDVSKRKDVLTAKRPRQLSTAKPIPAKTPGKAGPKPRWACAETTVSIAPTWSGPTVECVFTIRNEGKGDLNIKANGG